VRKASAQAASRGGRGVGPSLRHYAPVLVAAAAFAAVVALVPSRSPASPGALGADVSGSPHGGGATGPVPPPPDRPQSGGVAVSGVRCGPGVRQVPWSKYAPWCQPAFHGNNGGSTSPGVTATTITLTYREAVTAAEEELGATFAPSLIGTNAEAIATMRAYISVFNKYFELYGRHVVLKPFVGKGDFLAEDQGEDQSEADADAAHAKSLGAFADISLLASTPPYDDALANDGVISIGGTASSLAELQAHAPYEYTPGPDCEKAATAAAAVIGRSMAHLPAIFAGDPAMRTRIRTFGLIAPDNPMYQGCAKTTVEILKDRYHVVLARQVYYSFDLADLANQAANAIAQLKAAGVTSVLCACDPLTPIYLTEDANQQDYHPEWFALGFGDAFSRLPAQNQWSHAVSGGLANVPRHEQEAYKVYRMAVPKGKIIPTYASIYEPLLLFFDALQAAGPDLTPENFEKGFWSLPPSLPGGQFGEWTFGPGSFDPAASFQMLWWDPHARSVQDGDLGTWEPCNGGASYLYANYAASLPMGKQLQCFESG